MKRLKAWLRKKLIKFLELPETFIGVDCNVAGPSSIIVMRVKKGNLEVIAERSGKYDGYTRLMNDVEALARKYNVQKENVTIDAPRDFYN